MKACPSPTPGRPSQRGTNEDERAAATVFPKRADPRSYTVEDLRRVEDLLNNRPPKTSGGPHPQPHSVHSCQMTKPTLRRPIESALEPKAAHASAFNRR